MSVGLQNLKSLALPIPGIIGVAEKFWQSMDTPVAHAPFFTVQCTLVQSAVLRSHVVRLSVCLSVTLVIFDHRLKILETNCTDN